MIDFQLDYKAETVIWHLIFFLFFYLLAYFSNRELLHNYIKAKYNKNKTGVSILIISTVLLTIAAYTRGDFFHYAEVVQTGIGLEHMEDTYEWLAYAVGRNYLIWRIIVFGGALSLVLLTIKRFQVDFRLSIFVFFICYILVFNYARASLAFSVFFFGLSYIIKPLKNRIISYVVGISILLCSNFFHTSSIVLIVLTPIFLVPINKWTVSVIILLVFLSVNLLYNNIVDIMASLEGEEISADIFMYYQQKELSFSGGVSGFLTNVLHYSSFYVPFVLITKSLFFSKNKADHFSIILYKYIFGIIVIATLFGISKSSNIVYFYRVLYMSIIPITIEIVYMYKKRLFSRNMLRWCVYCGFTSILFITVYDLYLKLL